MISRKYVRLFALLTLVLFPGIALTQEPVSSEKLLADLDVVELRMSELAALNEQIETAAERDKNTLLYRRDERSFEILVQVGALTRAVGALPEDDAVRIKVVESLRADMLGAGEVLFKRLDELDQRIEKLAAAVGSLSGGQRVAAESFVHTLESMRVKYFEASVDLLESRDALGLPVEDVRTRLVDFMTAFGESLIGRIELSAGASREISKRLKLDPGNADLQAGLTEMQLQNGLETERLALLVGLLNRLGEDTAHYRSILLKYSTGVSVGIFDAEVVLQLLRDSWVKSREAIVANSPDMALKLLVFLLVLLIFRALSRLTRRAVGAALERSSADLSHLLKDILVSASSGTVMIVGVLMALSQIGISLAPMLAGLGVAGFIVGFALQDTLGNFAAGAMILIYRPYDVDDFVEVTGASGLVKKMTLVSTTITTFDNQTLVVPNSKIWGDVIKNVTAQKVRRVDLEFGIGYSDDIPHAERVLNEVVDEHEKTLNKPAPIIKLHTLGDSSVNFVVRPWVRTEDYWDVYWDITREVKMRFDREGISIPFPQRDVHLYPEVNTPSQDPS